jgi:hypothetical protein
MSTTTKINYKNKTITVTRTQVIDYDFPDWLDALDEEMDKIAAETLWERMVDNSGGEVDVGLDRWPDDDAWAKEALDELTEEAKEQIKEENDIVFNCASCNVGIVRDSCEHDECITADGDAWYCFKCSDKCPQDEDEE